MHHCVRLAAKTLALLILTACGGVDPPAPPKPPASALAVGDAGPVGGQVPIGDAGATFDARLGDPTSVTPVDLSAELESLRATYALPALAGAIYRDGTLLGFGAAGTRALGQPVAVTPSDRWHLGSCTKAMTATLVGMFVEAGLFDWSTPLSALLPDAAIHPSYASTTIEMLLQHRGGMPSVEPAEVANDLDFANQQGEAPAITRRRVVYYMLARPAPIAVGQFEYSNAGYVAAGVVLERLSGIPWETLIRQHLFAPLGMTSCGFGPAATPPAQLDQPWGHYDDNGTLVPQPPDLYADNPAAYGPAGTVHCSLDDWAKFLTEHTRGPNGQSQLGSKAMFDRLHAPPPGASYAAGWDTDPTQSWSGGVALTHSGSNTLNGTTTWLAPAKGLVLVAASNAGTDAAFEAIDGAFHPMIERFAF